MDVTSVKEPGWLHAVSNSSESLLHFPKHSHIKVLLLKHLLLKASHCLELTINKSVLIHHINLTMGRANGVAGLSLMFEDIPACPCSLFITSQLHWDFPLFANEKKSFKKVWYEKHLACTHQLLRCYCWACTARCVTPFLSRSVTALQVPWPLLSCHRLHPVLRWPERGSSSAGERAQLHKPAGAALHKCPGQKQCSLTDLYSHSLFHALDPCVHTHTGWLVCTPGAVKSLQQRRLCWAAPTTGHHHHQTLLRDKAPEAILLPGSPVHLTAACAAGAKWAGTAALPYFYCFPLYVIKNIRLKFFLRNSSLSLETKTQQMVAVTTVKPKWTFLSLQENNWRVTDGCPSTHRAGPLVLPSCCSEVQTLTHQTPGDTNPIHMQVTGYASIRISLLLTGFSTSVAHHECLYNEKAKHCQKQ